MKNEYMANQYALRFLFLDFFFFCYNCFWIDGNFENLLVLLCHFEFACWGGMYLTLHRFFLNFIHI